VALWTPSVEAGVCLIMWAEQPVPSLGVHNGHLSAGLPHVLQVVVADPDKKQGRENPVSPTVRLPTFPDQQDQELPIGKTITVCVF
jgi:hypothetical protein